MCKKMLSLMTLVLALGLVSSAAADWVVLTSDDFETGWGSYTDGGGDCRLYTGGTYAHQGSNAANIQDNSGVASSFYYTNGVDVDGPEYTQIKVDFWFYARNMENGEDFWVQYYDGSTWHTVADYDAGDEFLNSQFYHITDVIIDEGPYNFPADMQIRFMCDASANRDDVYIDEVVVSAWSEAPPDTDPPTPDPATFASPPAAISETEITMTATTGSDASPPVQYFFACTAGGGHDSGWTTDPVYTDTGLQPNTQYTYTVQMRDSIPNIGTASAPASATTPDNTPPTPDPMTWATPPYSTGTSSIAMVATAATDASGVEYYFQCTSGGGNDSGWQDSTFYEDTGLSPDTQYCYQV